MATTANPIPDPTTKKPPRRRRWVPLSLRFVLVFLPFVGIVGFTWVSVRGYRNALAIREIERVDGEIRTCPRASEWLQKLIHDDRMEMFDEVTFVKLESALVTDSWLAHLSSLSSLEDLYLTNTQVTDAGLARLTGLSDLQTLGLDGTRVTDAGLARLAVLTSLQSLNLDNTQVTDAGLAHLSGLTNLKDLSLKGTQVTDAGLAHLSGLTSLQRLELQGTQVTDAGLAHLKGLTSLRRLDLEMTHLTDTGPVNLKGLTSLQDLMFFPSIGDGSGNCRIEACVARVDDSHGWAFHNGRNYVSNRAFAALFHHQRTTSYWRCYSLAARNRVPGPASCGEAGCSVGEAARRRHRRPSPRTRHCRTRPIPSPIATPALVRPGNGRADCRDCRAATRDADLPAAFGSRGD